MAVSYRKPLADSSKRRPEEEQKGSLALEWRSKPLQNHAPNQHTPLTLALGAYNVGPWQMGHVVADMV